jgi:cytochrome c biogenesis protein CcmG/thiol:disulfide interchange protein DsbE
MANIEPTNERSWVEEQIARIQPSQDWQPSAARVLSRLRDRRARVIRHRRTWLLAGLAATAGSAGVMAFPPARAIAKHCYAAACAMIAPVSAGPETAVLSQVTDPGLPLEATPAPDFRLSDAYGRSIRLSEFRGKVVLLNFWATWCTPCRVEMPCFADFQRKYQDQGFTVLAVSLDEQGWQVVKPFAENLRLNFPIVLGNDEVADQFGGVDSLPMTFLLDREGNIRAKYTGLVSAEDYERAIQTLL